MRSSIVINLLLLACMALLFVPGKGLGAGGERDYKRIVVLADPHITSDLSTRKATQLMAAKEAVISDINSWDDVDLVVVAGDIMATVGTDEEYTAATAFFSKLNKPLRIISGNHDTIYSSVLDENDAAKVGTSEEMSANLNKFKTAFNQPDWYWSEPFDQYELYFLACDSNANLACLSDDQLDWLGNTLQDKSTRPSIVFFHAPLYGTVAQHLKSTAYANSYAAQPKDHINSLLVANSQVFMWVSGHTHTVPGAAFTHSRCLHADGVMNIHCSDMDRSSIFSRSLYIYEDRVEVRTYAHKKSEWFAHTDQVVALQPMPPEPKEQGTFDFVINTEEDEQTFAFYTEGASGFAIDWGDTTVEGDLSGSAVWSHNYEVAGVYTVRVSGAATRIAFGEDNTTTPSLLVDIVSKLSDGVTGITSIKNMFRNATGITAFTQADWLDDLSGDITSLYLVFNGASQFNQDISNWDVSQVTTFYSFVQDASLFNADISNWDTRNMVTLQYGFKGASSFNQDIGDWDVSGVGNFYGIFTGATFFNQDIGRWNTVKMYNMKETFYNAFAFNQDIGEWDVSKVTTFYGTFCNARAFNQDIGGWNVSKTESLYNMFSGATAFNQDIGKWDVSKVTSFYRIFYNTSFNQDISLWDTSSAQNMYGMFENNAAFNQNIGGWDVNKATSMARMLKGTTAFNQDISKWDVSLVTTFDQFLTSTSLTTDKYDLLWIRWSKLNLQPNVVFQGGSSKFSLGTPAVGRQHVIDTFGWDIKDNGSTGKFYARGATLITVR